jgi:GNAT superfamily N-acetyltransferase
MVRSRAADTEAGPADARMARYLDGAHHPQKALAARTAFVAVQSDVVIGYIAGHASTRHLHAGAESVISEPNRQGPQSGRGSDAASDPDATKGFVCEGEVQYLYVAPGARRRGVARELLRLLARWFDERGIRRVCVNADVESAGAAPFYIAAHARPLNVHWYVWDDIRTVSTPDHI